MKKQISTPLDSMFANEQKQAPQQAFKEQLSNLNEKAKQAFFMMETYKMDDNGKKQLRTYHDMEAPTSSGGEGETGYKNGLEAGLTYFFENLDQDISADWFIGIQDALTTGIMTEELPEGIPTGFRDASSGCEAMTLVSGETITEDGQKELTEKKKDSRYHFYDSQYKAINTNNYTNFNNSPKEGDHVNIMGLVNVKERNGHKNTRFKGIATTSMQTIIYILHFNYRNDISKATSTDERYRAIARFAKTWISCIYSWINIWTIGIFLLNKCLYDNDLVTKHHD